MFEVSLELNYLFFFIAAQDMAYQGQGGYYGVPAGRTGEVRRSVYHTIYESCKLFKICIY